MNLKKVIPLAIFSLIILISLIYAASKPVEEKDLTEDNELILSETQIIACNSADMGGTCESKLAELNIVSINDCCKYLGKCCR